MFWDLRDAFISSLYRGSVEGARLDSVLSHLDTVRRLNNKFFFPLSILCFMLLYLSVQAHKKDALTSFMFVLIVVSFFLPSTIFDEFVNERGML